jgi:hypothetical protein
MPQIRDRYAVFGKSMVNGLILKDKSRNFSFDDFNTGCFFTALNSSAK